MLQVALREVIRLIADIGLRTTRTITDLGSLFTRNTATGKPDANCKCEQSAGIA
jgi:hypothetical protein